MAKLYWLMAIPCFTTFSAQGQYWYKKYLTTQLFGSQYDIESYDKGFYISAYEDNPGIGLLLKTDVNGNILWQRTIGGLQDSTNVGGISGTLDGGLIITGELLRNDSLINPYTKVAIMDFYLLKLNPCGEKEWCKIYRTTALGGSLCQVQQLNDSSFVCYFYVGGLSTDYNCGVYHVNKSGNLIWQKYSLMTPENMMVDDYGNSIVTGSIYIPYLDSSQNSLSLHSNALKIDTSGNALFDSRYDMTKHIISEGRASQATSDGGYLTAGAAYGIAKNPQIIAIQTMKNDRNGIPQWNKPLIVDTTKEEYCEDMCKASDSTYIIVGQQCDTRQTIASLRLLIMKVDANGNLLKRVLYNSTMLPWKINNTSDGKFIIAGQENNVANAPVVALKINSDLGIDSEYHVNYKYDYLCSNGVKLNDTIPIKGSDTVHLDIPVYRLGLPPSVTINNCSISIYPNPAIGYVYIKASGLNKNMAGCSIYNILGEEIKHYSFDCLSGSLNEKLDLSGLANGVYFINIFGPNGMSYKQTIVKQ